MEHPAEPRRPVTPLPIEVAFCLELGRALQAYGTPAHRFEDIMARVCRRFDLEGQFFAMPTGFLASIGGERFRRTFVERGGNGDMDLGKLSRLHEITEEVLSRRLDASQATEALREAVARPRHYGPLITTVCFGFASGFAALFFGGGWHEMVDAIGCGLIVGILGALATRTAVMGRLYYPLVAFSVAFFAVVFARWCLPASPQVVTIAGLIVLIPGLGLLISMNELATGNLVAGTARLAGVGLIFLQLAFGVALGQRLAAPWLERVISLVPHALPPWALGIGLVLWPLALLGLFQAQFRDVGWIFLACLLGFGGARLGAYYLGPEYGVGLGALVLGLGSNLLSRHRNRPAIVTLLPGLLLLVPGSLGFRSLAFVIQKQVVAGLDIAFQMVFLAVALLTGLLLANVTVKTKTTL